jgi:ferredoxin
MSASPRTTFTKARVAHKWLMALVGIQVLIWSLTGAYMVLPNIHYIHGDHIIKQTQPNLDTAAVQLSFNQVLKRYPNANNIRLGWLGEKAIYRFDYLAKDALQRSQVMLDANSGNGIRPLQLVDAITLVPQLLATSGLKDGTESLIESIVLIDIDSIDYPWEIGSKGLPLWQIELNSWDNTRLYISEYSGEVVYIRHHAWRIFDLFWRLHIMDYEGGDEPENWLLAVVSVISLLAIIAGLLMLYFKIRSPIVAVLCMLYFKLLYLVRYTKEDASLVILYFRMVSATGYRQAKVVSSASALSVNMSLRSMVMASHKWLALIVFVQLFLWVGSGFLLARIDHSLATGKLTKIPVPAASEISPTKAQQLININAILAKVEHAESVYLELLVDDFVFRVQHNKGRHDYQKSDYSIFDAKTGSRILITQETATQLALASYNTEGLAEPIEVVRAIKYKNNIPELPKEQNAAWQVGVNDALNTNIILNAQTGSVIAHVNDETPLRNLLFKLHFMDYANNGSFNNIFIKLFALLTLVLSFTGLYWLFERVKNKQFSLPTRVLGLINSQEVFITVVHPEPLSDGNTKSHHKIKVIPSRTMLDELTRKGYALESPCGGAGLCGQCICQLTINTVASAADKELLTEEMVEQKFRLACQHKMSTAKHIIVYE